MASPGPCLCHARWSTPSTSHPPFKAWLKFSQSPSYLAWPTFISSELLEALTLLLISVGGATCCPVSLTVLPVCCVFPKQTVYFPMAGPIPHSEKTLAGCSAHSRRRSLWSGGGGGRKEAESLSSQAHVTLNQSLLALGRGP